MEIRRASPEDWRIVCAVHSASVRGLGGSHYTLDQIDSWSQIPSEERFLQSLADSEVYVAEREGMACGYGCIAPSQSEIQAVYVSPDAASSGVGRAILDFLEARGRDMGLERLRLRSSLNAEDFYEAAGWQVVERGTHLTRGGVEIACVLMEKQIRM